MTKISLLPPDAVPNLADIIALISSGNTSRATLQQIRSLLLPATSVDTNGWEVYDYGNWKEYAKTYTWSGSQSIGAGANFLPPAMALPVGISDLTKVYVTFNAVANDRVVLINYRTPSATSIPWEVNNYTGGAFTLTSLSIDVVARTK